MYAKKCLPQGRPSQNLPYIPELVSANLNVRDFLRELQDYPYKGRGIFTTIQGKKGTGKTRLAYEMLAAMGRKVHLIKFSDIFKDKSDVVAYISILRKFVCEVNKEEEPAGFILKDDIQLFEKKNKKPEFAHVSWVNFISAMCDVYDNQTFIVLAETEKTLPRDFTHSVEFHIQLRPLERGGQQEEALEKLFQVPLLDPLPCTAITVQEAIDAYDLYQNRGKKGEKEVAQAIACVQKEEAENVVPLYQNQDPLTQVDVNLIYTDQDIDKITRLAVEAPEQQGMTFCLYGPSGTGKSMFAQHMAEKMGLNLKEVTPSSIVGSYIGESARNMRDVFIEGAKKQSILLFDEVDGLFYDRGRSERLYHTQMMGEVLTQIERYPYPILCTTNYLEALDKALLRRFIFKIEFRPLDEGRLTKAWHHFFGESEMPVYVKYQKKLTLGDFALTYKKARILNGLEDPQFLAQTLCKESSYKEKENEDAGRDKEDALFEVHKKGGYWC